MNGLYMSLLHGKTKKINTKGNQFLKPKAHSDTFTNTMDATDFLFLRWCRFRPHFWSHLVWRFTPLILERLFLLLWVSRARSYGLSTPRSRQYLAAATAGNAPPAKFWISKLYIWRRHRLKIPRVRNYDFTKEVRLWLYMWAVFVLCG